MSRTESKAARFSQIEALLMAHPRGLTQSEIASRLGVHRSTILRNLADLSRIAPIYEGGGRYYIDRESYLVNVRLNLHEALSIHLAGRLMSACMDRQNPHAAAAFRKLGLALETLAPQISRFVLGSAETFDNAGKRQDPRYLQVLEKLALSWAGRLKTRLWYRGADGGQVKEYVFAPLFIEVGAVGQAIYAIGQIEPGMEMRTFKIERVERIELLAEPCSPANEFDPEVFFARAWNIWYSDNPPVEVVLRFSPRVAARVRETRWHPSEDVTPCDDGSLIWKAAIAEPKEMTPWIRGWGADCEVLAPEGVREKMSEEAAAMNKLYNQI